MKADKNTILFPGFIAYMTGLLFFLFSCEEEVTLDLNTPENQRIVVEGRIISAFVNQNVRITKTLSYFENELAPPLTDAEVYLIEEGSGREFPMTLSDNSQGIYETESFAGRFGETYSLVINDHDQSYKASAYLDIVPLIDSLTYEYQYVSFFGFSYGIYTLKISTYEPPPEGQYYRIDVYLNDTLFTDDIFESVYLSDFQINDRYLSEVEIFDFPQERINLDTNRIRIIVYSVSEDEINFLNEFISETYGNGSIFTGPPSNIQSNIKNTSGGLDGVGYFSASGVCSIESVLIKEHDESTNNPFYEDD